MKKICIVICILLALCTNCFAESTGIWQLKYYVDEFKLPTDEAYITTFLPIEGTFCNSAVDDAPLNVSIVIDEDSFAFVLYEYGDNKVKNSYSKSASYNIIMLDDARNKTNLKGKMNSGSDRIYLGEASAISVKEALLSNTSLSFYIEEADRPSTNYLFSIYDTSGFATILDKLDVSLNDPQYQEAVELFEAGRYEQALHIFDSLDGYKDSEEWGSKYKSLKYEEAVALLFSKDYDEAAKAFEEAGEYNDAYSRLPEVYYLQAENAFSEGKMQKAAICFAKAGNYKDAQERSNLIWAEVEKPITLSAQMGCTLALKEDGTVVFAGRSWNGEGNINNWNNIKSIFNGGNNSVGLKENGTVIVTGINNSGECETSNWTNIVAISASFEHVVGLKADGTVVATGENEDGKCNVSDWKDIIAISCGSYLTAGLKADGTVLVTGEDAKKLREVAEWTGIKKIIANSGYLVGLKEDGTVVIAGFEPTADEKKNEAIIARVPLWTDIKDIDCNLLHIVGLKEDGTVVTAGINESGQCNVGNWSEIVAIACGRDHTVGLRADGTVVAVGSKTDGRCNVGKWTDIVGITCGYDNTIGIKADGTLVAVGNNDYDQCDVKNWTNIKLPNGMKPRIIYQTLQQGMKGADVQKLQEKMIEMGALTGNADGDYGKKTAAAVSALQKQFGMEETGIADAAFQEKLYV